MTVATCWEKMSNSLISAGMPGPSSRWANRASLKHETQIHSQDFFKEHHKWSLHSYLQRKFNYSDTLRTQEYVKNGQLSAARTMKSRAHIWHCLMWTRKATTGKCTSAKLCVAQKKSCWRCCRKGQITSPFPKSLNTANNSGIHFYIRSTYK